MELPSRHSQRKPGHDYSQPGVYFITICTQNMTHLFGEVVDDKMVLNEAGKMINQIWRDLQVRYPTIELDEFIIMPNHLHGIIMTNLVVRAGHRARTPKTETNPPKHPSIIDIIHSFKSYTTHMYMQGVHKNNWEPFLWKMWQRNFYDHIVEDMNGLEKIRTYIRNNPKEWGKDSMNSS